MSEKPEWVKLREGSARRKSRRIVVPRKKRAKKKWLKLKRIKDEKLEVEARRMKELIGL